MDERKRSSDIHAALMGQNITPELAQFLTDLDSRVRQLEHLVVIETNFKNSHNNIRRKITDLYDRNTP